MSKSAAHLIPGLQLGHYTDLRARTGCSVLLCGRGAVAGVDIRGSAAGTREIEACQPGHLVEKIHAVVLAGGSAFGLVAADGVMEFLEQRGVGFDAGVTCVPIVASAIIFDLAVGSAWIRPDHRAGYSACAAARSDRVEQGRVGVGTGAMVGKLFGIESASPGGFGFSSRSLTAPENLPVRRSPRGKSGAQKSLKPSITVQAFAVVNAFGDVIDPRSGKILAGARIAPRSSKFADTWAQMKHGVIRREFGIGTLAHRKTHGTAKSSKQSSRAAQMSDSAHVSHRMIAEQMPRAVRRMFEREGADTASRFNLQNTTIAVVATDAAFDKIQMQKIAQMAQNGLARVLRPAHTMFDGDTVFALSIPDERHPRRADVNVVGEAAAETVAEAIVRAVKAGGE